MENLLIYSLDGSDEEVENVVTPGPLSVEQELDKFRKQWQRELGSQRSSSTSQGPAITRSVEQDNNGNSPREGVCDGPSKEEQATFLFLQGVNAEEAGRFFEAIQFYRRAVQLVPDIEFRVGDYKTRFPMTRKKERTISECSTDSISLGEHEDPDDLSNLLSYFQKLKVGEHGYCSESKETRSAHISDLPLEVLQYIFKWVVSSHLDVVSLEYLSLVSRGFFICSRDDELWRLICRKVWGRSCGDATNYGTYRDMYYLRPHLRFSGCYISRASYYRQGEKTLNSFYKPFHTVEYYRYVRFFPEGYMLFWTSPDDPTQVLPKLQSKYSREQGLMYGYYRLAGNMVTAALKRKRYEYKSPYERFRRKNQNNEARSLEQSFHVEFELCNSGSRKNSQLQWHRYSIISTEKATGEQTSTDFELNNKTYPPLLFSRVKSYTRASERILDTLKA